jgi:Transposase IS4
MLPLLMRAMSCERKANVWPKCDNVLKIFGDFCDCLSKFTLGVFRCFIGAYMLVSISKSPSMRDLWDTGSSRYAPNIAKLIGRNRFMAINSALTKTLGAENSSAYYGVWFKMMKACQTMWIPSEQVAIDETLLHYVGHFIHHYCIPRKPAKNGVKLIGLCDSLGWVCVFDLCKRKQEDGARLDSTPVTDV